jgi:hypothetical protein
LGSWAGRIPVSVWLTAIVAVSAVFRGAIAGDIVAPFIMVDEVIWAELARGFADAGEPLLRGEPDPGYSVLYPLVISPVYAIFDSLPTAYEAAKAVNAVLMSLAAVPAYFLSRRVVGKGMSLLAALVTVAIPSLAYVGTVMTENLFYPLFLVVGLVLVIVLEQPTWRRVALLVGAIGLAFATRVQAAAFVPAVLLAPLVLAALRGESLRQTLLRFRLVYGVLVGLGVLALLVQLAAGRSLQDLLGAYSPVSDAGYELGEILRYVVWHGAELALYLLVIPVAATIVLVCRARSLDARLQALLAATIALTASFIPIVAAFASEFSGERIEERNLFYLAPLYVVVLLAWVELGAPRPRVIAPAAAAGSALVVLALPFDRFLDTSAISDTLMLLPFWSLQDRIGSDWITFAALVLCAALAAAFLLVPARYAIALPLLVLGLWAVAFRPIWWGKHGFEQFSEGSLFQGIRAEHRDWIDRALPDGATAGFLWSGRTDRLTVSQNEFFNRGVGPVYYVTNPTPGGLPETQVVVSRRTGLVTTVDGEPVRDRFVVVDPSFEPDGVELGRDEDWGLSVWRVNPPLVSAVRIDGLYPQDTWSEKTVTYLRRRCRPGRLVVHLSSDPGLFLEPQTIVARSNGRVVGRVSLPPDKQRALAIALAPPAGSDECRVAFTVTPTAVPSQVMPGSSDDRELGAHFNRFTYVPDS